MFAWWGRTVYRYRYIVIAVMVALCVGGGIYGASLGKHVTQSGFYDEGSSSVKASLLADGAYGRDTSGHIIAIYTAPDGKTVDDPDFQKKILDNLAQVERDHPDEILRSIGYFKSPQLLSNMADASKKHAFMSIQLKGNDDDTILNNYKKVDKDFFIKDVDVKLAGLQPLAAELTGTIGEDQQRAEVAAIPLVAVLLFFVFGGVVAASLPAIIGGLSILGALGIMRLIALVTPVHFFAQPVVTLIGLGIAIDYGLFIVSRFREEIAEGYDTEAAVRRTMMTSGRTVIFSAVIIVASSLPLLLFPQGFLKSITYAIIASVMLSAVLSITVLAAILAILGPNVDALGVRTLLRVPFLRNWGFSRAIIDWFAEKTQKTKTREEVEAGFWGKLVNRVMKRPILFAAPIVIFMIVLIVPLGKLSLGGISEKYLPPDNSVRTAQEEFDKIFPGFRTEPITLVMKNTDGQPVTDQQVAEVRNKAMAVSGFTDPDNNPDAMWKERSYLDGASKDPSVRVIQNGLVNRNDAAKKIAELRSITPPKGVSLYVGGTPALEQDSIHSLFAKLPLMVVLLIVTTTILMFLAFGSLVLPIKAALMSALTLGSTMGVLTWMFVDGHGSGVMNYTPQPLMAPMIGLIIAVIYGLSTDYEVFLVSRMVEARERGMSTTEAIRIGTATTGRLITAAALVLAVVAGAFVFSDLVMMKYLAFGLLIALLLDATIVRMFLVPAIMKLLGDDCWWAPRWMKRLQNKIGLGETHLPDERKRPVVREPDPALVGAGAPVAAARPVHDPTHPGIEGRARPRVVGRAEYRNPPPQEAPSAAGTARMADPAEARTEITEAPTTRFSVAKNAVKNAVNTAASATRANRPPAPPAPDREIESWLGELRGKPGAPTPPPQPSAEPTRAMSGPEDTTTAIPNPNDKNGADDVSPAVSAEETRAIPVSRPDQGDSEVATEKLNSRGKKEGEEQRRRGSGGGVSAADLLRREGRL
ncbi:MMPL family transporter [Mycobacterium crocinum]|uniref:MMPL family transporter n=1 Tax=Mycolicibacterium crocinum TaxID=388459 RepID=A0ABY3TQC5_9MYCO|nr:MMPL family transporter [Mycolicibacterium crocinum]MCV7216549.1 MMPL family transporter [Mycolicibacterium crocinum]ULN41914.1 MMPL family transporter [Mycolicibacterium crocinum]